jgi:hypothetical protein
VCYLVIVFVGVNEAKVQVDHAMDTPRYKVTTPWMRQGTRLPRHRHAKVQVDHAMDTRENGGTDAYILKPRYFIEAGNLLHAPGAQPLETVICGTQ